MMILWAKEVSRNRKVEMYTSSLRMAWVEFMSSPDNSNKPFAETGPAFLASLKLNMAQRKMVEKHTRSTVEW